MESTIVEDGQSVGASLNAPISNEPALSAPMMSTQWAEDEEVIPVTRPNTQLQGYSLEFVGLIRSWSGLLNQASIFDV